MICETSCWQLRCCWKSASTYWRRLKKHSSYGFTTKISPVYNLQRLHLQQVRWAVFIITYHHHNLMPSLASICLTTVPQQVFFCRAMTQQNRSWWKLSCWLEWKNMSPAAKSQQIHIQWNLAGSIERYPFSSNNYNCVTDKSKLPWLFFFFLQEWEVIYFKTCNINFELPFRKKTMV